MQHAAVLRPYMRGRRMERLGGLVALLQVLRRRHDLPQAPGGQDGQRVRRPGRRPVQGDAVLRRRGALRADAGLPLHRLGRLERLLPDVQRPRAPLEAHPPVRLGRRRLLRGLAEGVVAVQPRRPGAHAPRVRRRPAGRLRAGRLVRLGHLQRQLRRWPGDPRARARPEPRQRRQGLRRAPDGPPAVRRRRVPRARARGLRLRRVGRVGCLRQVWR
mmetsp:Transcript_41859/g.119447  ORF Transcript_41859/g.119447 Transcript_41859/m.119447 type:complete len:216 (-) Transcript_41859:620-1267(-)